MRHLKIKEIGEVISGSTPKTEKKEYWDGEINWVTPKELGQLEGKYLDETERKITKSGFKSCSTRLIPPGNILFTSRAPIGHIAINNIEVCTNQGFKSIILKDNYSVEYIYYALKRNVLKLQDLGTGSTFKELSKGKIEEFKIEVPSLPDQLHIANLLSKAETLISQRKESIRLLDEFLKSTFLEMFGDPETNPKKFPFTELEKLCSTIVDCPHSTPLKSKEITIYPCIRTSELTNGYISWDSMQYLEESEYKLRTQRLVPEEGDIVYGREGTFGEAIRIPKTHKFSLGQRTMLFRPNFKKTNSIYLWAMVRSEFVYRQAKKKNSGSTVGHVNVKDIRQFRILYPPISLQTQFAQIVEKTEALKTQYQQSLRELENLYGSLSQKAFKGELTIKPNP
jgi:type I restriction enzyme, S subunit